MGNVERIPLGNLRRRSSSATSHDTSPTISSSSRHSFSHLDPHLHPSRPARDHGDRLSLDRTNTTLGRLRYYEALLDRKLGLEGGGPERVLPGERERPKTRMMALLWTGATLNLGCFASGLLGWELGLTFAEAFAMILVGSLLGGLVTGWCAILGPPTGLRQVSISRYSLGWNAARAVALLNIITALGFSAVSCIAAGFALTALSNGLLSPTFGIALTCFNATFFSFFGLRGVMWYQNHAWILCSLLFAVVYLVAIPQADISPSPPTDAPATTSSHTSALLALLSVSYGSCGGWASVTSDFYVHFDARTPAPTTLSLTALGLSLSNTLGMTAGALVGATMASTPAWLAAYRSPGGVGALLSTVIRPPFLSTLTLLLFVLSGTGMNAMGIYTGALSLQQLGPALQAVPRSLWTLVFFLVILLVAIPGQAHLLPLVENLLATLGYWNSAFFVVLFAEHHLFRAASVDKYNLDAWNTRDALPAGWAGGAAFAAGSLASLAGMHESWYVGPVARWVGGDVGNLLAAAVAAAVFVPGRVWERRATGL